MKRWVLPENRVLRRFDMWMASFLRKNPDYLRENTKIEAFYGVLHQTVWAGGRVVTDENYTIDQMEKVLAWYKTCKIDYYFVFTQRNLTDEMLADYWGDVQLKLAEKYDSKVLVASDKLEKHIREKYPSIKILSSTTKLNSLEDSIEEVDKYYQVVASTKENFNLDKIPKEKRGKIEILVNDCCPPDCIMRAFCYATTANENLGKRVTKLPDCYNNLKQGLSTQTNWNEQKEFLKHLFLEDVLELEKKGFQFFKLTGREAPLSLVYPEILYYLIKDDYQLLFLENVILGIDLFKERLAVDISSITIQKEVEYPKVMDYPFFDKRLK